MSQRVKIAFVSVIFLSSYRLWSESAKADVQILRLLLDQNIGLIVYLAGVAVVIAAAYTNIGFLRNNFDRNMIYALAAALVVVSVIGFFVGTNPPIDRGPDHDEATEAWIDAFLEGEYPYNPDAHVEFAVEELTVFPALPVLAFPFYLLYDVALLMIVGVVTVTYVLLKESRSQRAGALALTALLLSVPLHYRLVSHSNYVELSAMFILGLWFYSSRRPIIAGTIFSIVFAMKTNTWPLLPMIAFAVLDRWNIREIASFALVGGAIASALLVPFIVWDPYTFFNVAPLDVASSHQNTFGVSQTILGIIVVFATLITYSFTRQLIVGVISGTFVLFLGFPGRYQLFLTVFIIAWAFTKLGITDEGAESRLGSVYTQITGPP